MNAAKRLSTTFSRPHALSFDQFEPLSCVSRARVECWIMKSQSKAHLPLIGSVELLG